MGFWDLDYLWRLLVAITSQCCSWGSWVVSLCYRGHTTRSSPWTWPLITVTEHGCPVPLPRQAVWGWWPLACPYPVTQCSWSTPWMKEPFHPLCLKDSPGVRNDPFQASGWTTRSVLAPARAVILKFAQEPWPVWLSWLGIVLQREGLPVRFPVRAHAQVAGLVSLSFSSSPLKINKKFFKMYSRDRENSLWNGTVFLESVNQKYS